MAKGKPQQHTAKEIAQKTKMATQNVGGGKTGKSDRLGGKAGHARYECYICKQQAPDLKSMGMHFESKHPKEKMDEAKFVDKHEMFGGTTQGVAVKGTLKKAKKKEKGEGEQEQDNEESE
jgi:hypothetical protein